MPYKKYITNFPLEEPIFKYIEGQLDKMSQEDFIYAKGCFINWAIMCAQEIHNNEQGCYLDNNGTSNVRKEIETTVQNGVTVSTIIPTMDMQIEYCEQRNFPCFAYIKCPHCKADTISSFQEKHGSNTAHILSTTLITGCPNCGMSWCD